MKEYYCVWWLDISTPEEQLMGIYETQEGAEGLVETIKNITGEEEVYFTCEKVNEKGECI